MKASAPTFTLRLNSGRQVEMPYRPLRTVVGTTSHVLALHRAHNCQEWVLSDPVSGGRVLMVRGRIKGIPVSSHDLTESRAAAQALRDLHDLVERIGAERFNETLAEGRMAPTIH